MAEGGGDEEGRGGIGRPREGGGGERGGSRAVLMAIPGGWKRDTEMYQLKTRLTGCRNTGRVMLVNNNKSRWSRVRERSMSAGSHEVTKPVGMFKLL